METQTQGKSRISEIAESQNAKVLAQQAEKAQQAERDVVIRQEVLKKMFMDSFKGILPMLKEAGIEFNGKVYPRRCKESFIEFSKDGRQFWNMEYFDRGQYKGRWVYHSDQRPGHYSMEEFCFFLDTMLYRDNTLKTERIMSYLDTTHKPSFANDNEIEFVPCGIT